MQFSLRKRIILAASMMLVPLLLLGSLGYYFYLQTISAFERVVDETLEVTMPLMELHRHILQVTMPIDNHLIFPMPENQETFTGMSYLIDTQFNATISRPEISGEARQSLFEARANWGRIKPIGEAILRARDPANDPKVLNLLPQFDEQIRKISLDLERVYSRARENVGRQYDAARQTQRQIQILLAIVFALGMLAAIGGGNHLSRCLLIRMERLREGAERLGHGELRHRIDLDNTDELGQVAAAFNSMANELEFLASRDSLTGLYNKREFDLRLGEETKRAKRLHHPFALLLLDLDFFKAVNDTHGHQAGDQVLRVLGALLKKQVREVDPIGRTGGEEFGIILSDTSEQSAIETAERIREVVAEQHFAISENQSLRMTISIGVASYPDDAASSDVLVSCADQALYKAKQRGRNRVECFSQMQ